jgi:hypothetical protein
MPGLLFIVSLLLAADEFWSRHDLWSDTVLVFVYLLQSLVYAFTPAFWPTSSRSW